MRLHQPGDDAQVGFDEAPVEANPVAAARVADMDMRRIVAREMVDDAHRLQHPRIGDELAQFRAFVGAVQAGGDDDGYGVRRQSCIEQRAQQRRQQHAVRNRTRDVANGDAGGARPRCARREASPGEGLGDRRPGRVENRHRRLAHHRRAPACREAHRQFPTPVTQRDRVRHLARLRLRRGAKAAAALFSIRYRRIARR